MTEVIYKNMDSATLVRMLEEQILQNKELRSQIEKLSSQLAILQNMLFGQKSERSKTNKNKKDLDSKNQQADITTKDTSDTTNSSTGRRKLSLDIERQKIRYDLPEADKKCKCCQRTLHCIGKEISEQLDFIPARLIVKEHIRYKYACRCIGSKILIAPMPNQPIDKGLAGSGLLAEVLVNKYQDALPLYRQQMRWQRLGYELATSTLSDWVMQCAERLQPIVDAMIDTYLLKAYKIHTDDTVIPVLNQGKTLNCRLWVYVAGGGNVTPCVIYQYSKTRSQTVPQSFLKNYQGYLQADAYPGYNKLFEDNKIIEIGCMAHARRKFTDVAKVVKDDSLANIAIEYIAKLYKIEKTCKKFSSHEKYYYRRKYAKPILKTYFKWLNKAFKQAPPKSPLASAIRYTLNHWKALNNYLLEGYLDIDNNCAERVIRPFVIGRKNYLFAGSHRAAKNAAVIYSLIETCKSLNINTFDYFKDVLARLPNTLNKDISLLFPANWRAIA